MRRSIPEDFFGSIKFSTIGLGDSSYDQYNFIAKKLHKRIIQLKGDPLLDLCLCDDQNNDGIEGTFAKWIHSYWFQTFDSTHTSQFQKIIDTNQNNLILKYKTKILPVITSKDMLAKSVPKLQQTEATESTPFNARLTMNQRATSVEHWQNTRLLEFESDPSLLQYEAGDVLMLRPSNLPENVKKFYEIFEHLNLEKLADNQIEIDLNYSDSNFSDLLGTISTVGDLVERYFDLNSQPRMSFFEIFSQIASDELEKEKLEEFINSDDGGDGLEELYTYCYRPRRTICEVFYDFPKTCRNIKSLDVLLEMVPSLKPRAFSIASSPCVHKNKIQILVAVVEYKTRLFETRKGACSYWLSTLEPALNPIVPIWIKKGSFKFDWSKPLICIGPGTGVAPFRSIINERIERLKMTDNYLYFGCRSKQADFYFEKEWQAFENAEKRSLVLKVAFSQAIDTEKVYVQDLMLKDSVDMFRLIDELGANVLIAGSSKRMPQDVLATLEMIVKQNLLRKDEKIEGDLDQISRDYVKNLERVKRIQLETWA